MAGPAFFFPLLFCVNKKKPARMRAGSVRGAGLLGHRLAPLRGAVHRAVVAQAGV